ncbi:hypothetical protein FRC12_008565 [Ceratobasidium sp. 428]|nr:hypothetical protein FRC12_008565 [Ceratobasidium sp. 428]
MDLSSLWGGVTRTWAALRRETDEIEHVDAAIFALEERLSEFRGLIKFTHLDAVLRAISEDENRIDDIETRLTLMQKQTMFRRLQAQRITHSEADTPDSDPRARDAWDHAESIWVREARILQLINRMSDMRLKYRYLAEELQHMPSPTEISSYASSATPITADQFVRERRPSNIVPSAPASGNPTTIAKRIVYVLKVEGSEFEENEARAPLKPTASHHLTNC